MKAIICKTLGLPEKLEYDNFDLGELGGGQVHIKVNACSVNFPDTLIIQGKYQFKPELPFIPGSDIAGEVLRIGEKVKHFKPGDRVFGFTMTGGYAEEAYVDAKTIFPTPDGMDDVIASSFLLAYGTSYHALKDRAQLQSEEVLLVLGASGGVGLAAVQLGKAMGAQVIAATSSKTKNELCLKYGADHVINYSQEDLRGRIKEITGGKGIDVVYDPVGGDYSEAALRSLAWNGRHLVVGFATGEIPKIPLNLPLLKSCQVVGVFWGSFAQKFPGQNMKNSIELMQMLDKGLINPHIHKVYPLENAAAALEEMMGRQVMGKVVVSAVHG